MASICAALLSLALLSVTQAESVLWSSLVTEAEDVSLLQTSNKAAVALGAISKLAPDELDVSEETMCSEDSPADLSYFVPYPRGPQVPDAWSSGLQPKPTLLSDNPIEFCAVDSDSYKRHYMFFVHAVLASKALAAKTGLRLCQATDPFKANLVLCSALGLPKLSADPRFPKDQKQVFLGIDEGDRGTAHGRPLREPRLVAELKTYKLLDGIQACPCYTTGSDELWYRMGCKNRQSHTPPNFLLCEVNKQNMPGQLTRESASQYLKGFGCHNNSLSQEEADKVMAAIPLPFTVPMASTFPDHVLPLEKVVPIAQRPIHVFFTGQVERGVLATAAQQPVKHRLDLINALADIQSRRGWKIVVNKGRMDIDEYFSLLRSSKLLISPFGWGEWSTKDEEAAFNGAVVVKPAASLLDSMVNLYEPGVTCLEVRPDWSDLEEVIEKALADEDGLQRMQHAVYNAASSFSGYPKAVSNEKVLAVFGQIAEKAVHQLQSQAGLLSTGALLPQPAASGVWAFVAGLFSPSTK